MAKLTGAASGRSRALLKFMSAASMAAIILWTGTASAQVSADPSGNIIIGNGAGMTSDRPGGAEITSGIVGTTGLDPAAPAPGGTLDNAVSITGVGQVVVRPSQTSFGIGLCTGTLINPRTVIFAAHCVNNQAANSYGFASGGTAISVGFEENNRPAVRQWVGLDGGTANATNLARSLYNAEQVWYDPRSLALGPGNNFLQADIALATLDTPATDIPTWTMLFSPLTSEAHATLNGYGARGASGTSGANLGIDFRRRAVENMVSYLGSIDTWSNFLFGPDAPFFVQSLYQIDFDSPAGQAAFNPGAGRFDFDIFKGAALPREGTTAGGDSGGPLIIDQKFSRPVVAAVLSGGFRFFGPQPFATFGTTSFYQPLFLYWDTIVANNPYKYVTNIAGSRDWTDPTHWIQTMDPSYGVERNGQLVNALPGSLGLALNPNTTQFGSVCFLTDCLDITQAGPENAGIGAGLIVPGGPGSVNFVPNNVRSNPQAGISGRYYDVTLAASGVTRAKTAITIDRLTVDGATKLDIRPTGNLAVLGDFTQLNGWTNVDGLLKTGEALVASGILSGSGRVDPSFLTVGKAFVVPGGHENFGTLTVQGDLILSSATTLVYDISRNGSDKIVVLGDAANPGKAALAGTFFFYKLGSAPRHGQTFEVLTATGGVQGVFETVLGREGVLRPQATYGPNNVTVTLHAGSLAQSLINPDRIEHVFAAALDSLRSSSYNSLYGLYGAIDVMSPIALANTLRGLNPVIVGEAASFSRQQDGAMISTVSSRLSMLGTGHNQKGVLQVMGAPETVMQMAGRAPFNLSSAAQLGFARRISPEAASIGALPETMSGFLTGGVNYTASPYSDLGDNQSRQGWNLAMGLEMEASEKLTLGTAIGFSEGTSLIGGGRANSRTGQVAAYGSYQLGKGGYLAGLASMAHSRIGVSRSASDGTDLARLNASTTAFSYSLHGETGINLDVGKSLRVTPRAGLRYSALHIDRLREQGGELALDLTNIRQDRLEGRVGFQAAGNHKIGRSWTFTSNIEADMVRSLAGNPGSMDARFALANSVDFTLPFGSRDASWGEIKGGFRLTNGHLSVGAGVETNIGRSDYRDDRAVADLTVRF